MERYFPKLREARRLSRDMKDWDGNSWFLFSILMISLFLCFVGGIVYKAGAKVVGLSILLAPCALWLFLIFCSGAYKPNLDFCLNKGQCKCCSCLASLVFGLIILDIIQIIILSLPNPENKVINFDASNATFTRFNFTSSNNSILSYQLSLNVTVGPNKKKTGVYCYGIQAWAFYQGQNLTSLSIPPFYLGGKKNHTYNSTVVLHPVFEGQQAVALKGDGLRRYQKETAAGRYSIDVTLSYLGIRTNDFNDHNMTSTYANDTLNIAGHQLKGVVTFGLEVPLSSDVTNGIASPQSGATKSFEYKTQGGLSQLVMVAGFLFMLQFVF